MSENMDAKTQQQLDDIMRKYDKESATRIWEGTPKIIVRCVMAAFSL